MDKFDNDEYLARPYVKEKIKRWENIPELLEVELHLLNDEPINKNEDAAWAIIKGAYSNILFEDPHWHFFWEGKFNLIRCSEKFYGKLIEYLDECGVTYIERGKWNDGSIIVQKHLEDFGPLFHHFSMIALEENPYIYALFDRVAHCFLNHQYFAQKKFRDKLDWPSLWESKIIYHNAMARSHYIGRCDGINELEGVYQEKVKKLYEEKEKEEGDD